MPPISRASFRSILKKLDRSEFTQFVAAVWRQRGYETIIHDDVIQARDPKTGTEHRVRVHQPPWRFEFWDNIGSTTDIDIVVTAGSATNLSRTTDVRVIAADELRDMTLFAIKREAAQELFDQYFERPITKTPPPQWKRTANWLAERPEGLTLALVGSTVLLLMTASFFAGSIPANEAPATSPPSPAPPLTTIPPESEDQPPTPSLNANARLLRANATPIPVDPGLLPPGVSHYGIADSAALIEAHTRAMTGISFRLTLNYREFHANGSVAAKRERIVVKNASVYASNILTVESFPTKAGAYIVSDTAVYADGNVQYARTADPDGANASYRATPFGNSSSREYVERVNRYLRMFLAVEESHTARQLDRDGNRLYEVRTIGDPWQGVTNVTGTLLIDQSGRIHFLQRTYDVPWINRSVVITLRYEEPDTVTVPAPDWYPHAVNATTSLRKNASAPAAAA